MNERYTFLEYIGDIDTMGREIYVGDILIYDTYDGLVLCKVNENLEYETIVELTDFEVYLLRDKYNIPYENRYCVIIGNIYENKELVELGELGE